MRRRRSELERIMGSREPSWAGGSLWTESEAFEAITGSLRVDAAARAWLERWAEFGALSGRMRDYYKDEVLAGGLVPILLAETMGWWRDGGDDSTGHQQAGRIDHHDGSRRPGPGPVRSGTRGLPGDPSGPPGRRGEGEEQSHAGDVAQARSAPGVVGAVRADADLPPCECHRRSAARDLAIVAAGGGPVAHRAGVELEAGLLARAARSRAILATVLGGRGAGGGQPHGSRSFGPQVILVGVGERGRGSTWLVRGTAGLPRPKLVQGMCFPGAVRLRGDGGSGKLLAGPGAAVATCGLCGLPLFDGMGLEWAVAHHPLAVAWRGGV